MTNTFNDKLGRQVLGYAGYYASGAPDTSPLIPLAGRLGGQGDEASIGLANFDKDTFEETKAAHPELAGRSWDEQVDRAQRWIGYYMNQCASGPCYV